MACGCLETVDLYILLIKEEINSRFSHSTENPLLYENLFVRQVKFGGKFGAEDGSALREKHFYYKFAQI